MTSSLHVLITGTGMLTPVGDSTSATCAAIQGGIGAVALQKRLRLQGEDPEWDPPEPMRAARIPTLPIDVPGRERVRILALHALEEALRSAKLSRRDLASTALLVGVPSGDEAV